MATAEHRANSAKGGLIGGPKSPTSFKNNKSLAAAAGAASRRTPVVMVCPHCGNEIYRRDFKRHAKAEHIEEYKALLAQERMERNGMRTDNN